MIAHHSAVPARWCWLVIVCVLLSVSLVARAQEPAGTKPSQATELTPQQKERLKERDRYALETTKLRREGKLAEAVEAAEKMLERERKLFGEQHDDVIGSLELLAELHEERADFDAARKARQDVLGIQTKRFGEKDWRVTDARLALADLERLQQLGPEQRQQVFESRRLNEQVVEHYNRGRYRQAVELAARWLDLSRRTFGEDHQDYALALNVTGSILHSAGAHQQAEKLLLRGLAIRQKALGEDHPAVATSLNNLGLLYLDMGNYAKAEQMHLQAEDTRKRVLGEDHLDYATSLNNLGTLYQARGDFQRAAPFYRGALDIRKKVLGEEHPKYLITLGNFASLYRDMGDYLRAEPLYIQVLEARRKVLGDEHPDVATSLNNLGLLYKDLGDYAKAEPLYLEAAEIRKKVLGEKHASYATSLGNLGVMYQDWGLYAKAEPLLRQAMEVTRQALGEKHADYAIRLSNLAAIYHDMGDDARAGPLLLQALQVAKEALGEEHPDYATILHNVASIYDAQGEHAKAEALFRQSLEIARKRQGESHPAYAAGLSCLATVHCGLKDYAAAEPLYRQSLEIRRRALGEAHPDVGLCLNNLGALYVAQGEYERAEEMARQASNLWRKLLGESHPTYITSLMNLGMVVLARGDHEQGEQLVHRALELSRGFVELTANVLSERQQMLLADEYRTDLGAYLSIAPKAKRSGPDVYREVLRWKGLVFARQRHLRVARSEPELGPLFTELQSTVSRLASLAFTLPEPQKREAWQRQLTELTTERERLEADLARKSGAFRDEQSMARLDAAQVQALLPTGTALVDFLEYVHCSPGEPGKAFLNKEQHFAAFVVRPDRPVVQVDLGPVKPVAEAIDRWRQALHPGVGKPTDQAGVAALLRRLVWQPLEPHLKGIQTVLVSPDGVLARLPLAALPGSKPDSYLIEELALAVVPVPQLLPELLAETGRREDSEKPRTDGVSDRHAVTPSLLLVGDVDFAASSNLVAAAGSRSAARRGALREFPPLPATRGEILTVRDTFERRFADGKVRVLRGDQATESALRELAPQYRHLHLATHGFFAPPELRSALAPDPARTGAPAANLLGQHGISGFHPGLLSGLVLAGANQPPEPDEEDGILTALEVAELDLCNVELAVLSACETGLGEVAGGEGLLGLQRAFQVAGANAVVASLWQVPDQATRDLMERFYENLWRKKMPKLEALRDAQLALLRGDIGRGPGAIVQRPNAGPYRAPPRTWAAWVLSGDWR